MVLCAGLGTRLRPVTESIPKPLAPVFDVPVVEYTFEILASAGVKKAVVNLHHLPDEVRSGLGNRCRGVDIVYSLEPEILGAVGGVAKALEYVGDGPLLVVNGDVIVDFDPAEMMRKHLESGAALTMALGDVPGRRDLKLVGVESGTGRVVSIRNHQVKGHSPDEMLVNLGVFVYEGSKLRRYAEPGRPLGFSDELVPMLFGDGEKVMSVRVGGYWNDIGSIAAYLGVHADALEGRGTRGCLDAAVRPAGYSGEGALPPFFIGENAAIGPGAVIGPYAVIGKNSIVGEGARIEKSVVMPGSSVPPGARISGSVVHGDRVLEVRPDN